MHQTNSEASAAEEHVSKKRPCAVYKVLTDLTCLPLRIYQQHPEKTNKKKDWKEGRTQKCWYLSARVPVFMPGYPTSMEKGEKRAQQKQKFYNLY